MKIYDYNIGDLVEITDTQFDFMQAVIKHGGRIELALKDYPVSDEQITAWRADSVFWPVLEGHVTILIRARGLSSDYIKDLLLSTLAGKTVPTKEQMQAINTSVRALGMGQQPRPGFGGQVTVNPGNTTITFNDGLEKPANG